MQLDLLQDLGFPKYLNDINLTKSHVLEKIELWETVFAEISGSDISKIVEQLDSYSLGPIESIIKIITKAYFFAYQNNSLSNAFDSLLHLNTQMFELNLLCANKTEEGSIIHIHSIKHAATCAFWSMELDAINSDFWKS